MIWAWWWRILLAIIVIVCVYLLARVHAFQKRAIAVEGLSLWSLDCLCVPRIVGGGAGGRIDLFSASKGHRLFLSESFPAVLQRVLLGGDGSSGKFAACVKGAVWGWSGWRLYVVIGELVIAHTIHSGSDSDSDREKMAPQALPSASSHSVFANGMAKVVVRVALWVLAKMISVKIEKCTLYTTTAPPLSAASAPRQQRSPRTIMQTNIGNVQASKSSINIASIQSKEVILKPVAATGSHAEKQERDAYTIAAVNGVLRVGKLVLSAVIAADTLNLAVHMPDGVGGEGMGGIELDLWLSTLLFLVKGSLVDGKGNPSRKAAAAATTTEEPSNAGRSTHRPLLFSPAITISIPKIKARIHLPATQPRTLEQFSALSFTFDHCSLIVRSGPCCGEGGDGCRLALECAIASATVGSHRNAKYYQSSMIAKLFSPEHGLVGASSDDCTDTDDACGFYEQLLAIDTLAISNTRDTDNDAGVYWTGVCEWLNELLGTGRKQETINKKEWNPPLFLNATLQALTVTLPFEYCLANLLDSLAFTLKPLSKHPSMHKQSFNPFCGDWRLVARVQCVYFGIGDCAWERRWWVRECVKRAFWRKRARLISLFWSRVMYGDRSSTGDEDDSDSDRSKSVNTQHLKELASIDVDALLLASDHPLFLRKHPHHLPAYVRLEKALFALYRQLVVGDLGDEGCKLLEASVGALTLSLSWSPKWVAAGARDSNDKISSAKSGGGGDDSDSSTHNKRISNGIISILNTIDPSLSLQHPHQIECLSMLLGAHTEASFEYANVWLRGERFVRVPGAVIGGMVFLVEEEAYEEAIVRKDISVLNGDDPDPLTIRIERTILPIKLYHTLDVKITSNSHHHQHGQYSSPASLSVHASPFHEGSFQMLDRCIELFTRPSEDASKTPLPAWDKLRLCVHGGAKVSVSVPACLYWWCRGRAPTIPTNSAFGPSNQGLFCVQSEGGLGLMLDGCGGRLVVEAGELRAWWQPNYHNASFHQSMATVSAKELLWMYMRSPFYASDLATFTAKTGADDTQQASDDIAIAGGMPIIKIPALALTLSAACTGAPSAESQSKESALQTHTQVRLKAVTSTRDGGDGDFDAFKAFRTHAMHVSICIQTKHSTGDNNLLFFYYRQIEDALSTQSIVMLPSRRGRLFDHCTLQTSGNGSGGKTLISSVMASIHFRLMFDGHFWGRFLHFQASERGGGDDDDDGVFDSDGFVLASRGKTAITLAWQPANKNPETSSSGGSSNNHKNKNKKLQGIANWSLLFAALQFSQTHISILSHTRSASATTPLQHKQSAARPLFEYDGIMQFVLLEAPRLLYCLVNDDDDGAGLIGQRLAEIERALKEGAGGQSLLLLKEERDFIRSSLERERSNDKPSATRHCTNNHKLIIQDAQMCWHQSMRNALFTLVDNQFQAHGCKEALKYNLLALLFPSESGDASGHTKMPSVQSPISPVGSNADKDCLEALLESAPIDVGSELGSDANNRNNDDEDEDSKSMDDHMFMDPEPLAAVLGVQMTLGLQVQFDHARIMFIDEDTAVYSSADLGEDGKIGDEARQQPTCLMVTAKQARLLYGTFGWVGERVGRRTKVVLSNARISCVHTGAHSASTPSADGWPFAEGGGSNAKCISEHLAIQLTYNVSNQFYSYAHTRQTHPLLHSLFSLGDSIRVHADNLSITTNPQDYTILYSIIINLLVWRDESVRERGERVENLVIGMDLLGGDGGNVERWLRQMQEESKRARERLGKTLGRAIDFAIIAGKDHDAAQSLDFTNAADCEHTGDGQSKVKGTVGQQLKKATPSDLALIIEALREAHSQPSAQLNKQSRLQLCVHIGTIKWTLYDTQPFCEMMLGGIRDIWTSESDGAQSNLVTISTILAINLLPDSFYTTLIKPLAHGDSHASGIKRRAVGLDAGDSVRFHFRMMMAVGGIRIVEHAELNLAPLKVQLTYNIAERVIKFLFPTTKRKPTDPSKTSSSLESKKNKSDGSEHVAAEHHKEPFLSGLGSRVREGRQSFLHPLFNQASIDEHDISLIKERSAANCSFIYINVPTSQHIISYKGKSSTNITDIENFIVTLPDFEYHSKLWSWLEFLLQLRKDSIRVVLGNVGKLLKDKIKRWGLPNRPEVGLKRLPSLSGELGDHGKWWDYSGQSSSKNTSRRSSRVPSMPDLTSTDDANTLDAVDADDEEKSKEEEEKKKAKMLLGSSFTKK